MAELNTLARPYAKAAFEVARARDALAAWSAQLGVAAAVVIQPAVAAALASPSRTAKGKAEVVIDVCGDAVDTAGRNFLRTLAANKRLPLLPQIRELYEQYRARQEIRLTVTVESAFALEEASERALVAALRAKLQRDVTLEHVLEPRLLAGVVVRAGDMVLDGSVRGRLNQLAAALTR